MPPFSDLPGMARKLSWDFLLNHVASSDLLNSRMRIWFLRLLGVDVDPTVFMRAGNWLSGRKVSIGAGCSLNVQCFFDESAPIRIGANCNFGPQVMIHTSAHEIGGSDRRCGPQVPKPVTIGDGVWICLRASVLPGVTIGDGCLIAAGAVVTGDCEPNGLYAGAPARRIRDL
jgi:maltose O-acetyltransferase